MPPNRPNKDRDGFIWLLDQGGVQHTEIGRMFGLSRSRIGSIVQTIDRRLEFRMGMWTPIPHGKEPHVRGQLVPQHEESRAVTKDRARRVVRWAYLRPRCGICGTTAVYRVDNHEGLFFYDYSKANEANKISCPALLCNDCYMKSARWTGIKVAIIQFDDDGLEVTS